MKKTSQLLKTLFLPLIVVALAVSLIAAVPGPPKLSDVDALINKAIAENKIPGAVLVVGHRGKVVYEKAYGVRTFPPHREAMTDNTIFDLASLTKVVATAPSIMLLFQEGKIRLSDPVARYLPQFGANGKSHITVRMLLTHFSGLRPDPIIPPGVKGYNKILNIIYADHPIVPPGSRFIYSDCNFILLGQLVQKISGERLNVFAERHIFQPLGMKYTSYLPPKSWIPRIAPTAKIHGVVLRGVVEDPTARAMGGVAGHAGLFSDAHDLSIYAQMLLNNGRIPSGPNRGRYLLQPSTVHKMTSIQSPPWSPVLQGLGWDIDSRFASNRGELFPLGSYGHTGYTGTSIWIDPASQTYVILLTSRLYPHYRPEVLSLRSRLATLVAAALGAGAKAGPTSGIWRSIGAYRPYDLAGIKTRNDQTLTGIDVLEQEHFAPLQGKRVGLITNNTGVDSQGRRTIDVLDHAPGVKLVAIFSPEGGIHGTADTFVPDSRDPKTGLPIYSLYGKKRRRPTAGELKGINALVYDLQDAGVRFYTFTSTMTYCMEAAAKHHIPFYVLDRPDPLGGVRVAGPMLDPDRLSFVGVFPMPVIYGMTIGELAEMINTENHIGADLTVIKMKDWHRRDTYDQTGLVWIPPSPNLRTISETLLYPGIEILQNGGLSVGRGTNTPFQIVGAPYINARQFAGALNHEFIPGLRFVPTLFTPTSGIFHGQVCQGAELLVTDRASVFPMLTGIEIAATLHRLYPNDFHLGQIIELLGSRSTIAELEKGDYPSLVAIGWNKQIEKFEKMRQKFLLYHN